MLTIYTQNTSLAKTYNNDESMIYYISNNSKKISKVVFSRSIMLVDNSLSGSVIDKLKNVNSLTSVKLEEIDIVENASLISILLENKNITQLEFVRCSTSKESFEVITNFLKDKNNIKTLAIADENSNCNGIQTLLSALDNTAVEDLALAFPMLDSQNFPFVIDFIQQSTKLSCLDLCGSRLNDDDFELVLETVELKQNIKILALSPASEIQQNSLLRAMLSSNHINLFRSFSMIYSFNVHDDEYDVKVNKLINFDRKIKKAASIILRENEYENPYYSQNMLLWVLNNFDDVAYCLGLIIGDKNANILLNKALLNLDLRQAVFNGLNKLGCFPNLPLDLNNIIASNLVDNESFREIALKRQFEKDSKGFITQ